MPREVARRKTTTAPLTAARRSDPDRLVEAAIACFRKYGPAKTSMEDIAQAAGVGRRTVYRAFSSRTDLLDAVAAHRLRELAAKVAPVAAACRSIEEAVVHGSQETIRLARRDRLFMAVLESASDRGVERYLLDPASPVHGHMMAIWAPVFARARERGELRRDLADVEIATWLRAVHLILLLREDLDDAGQRNLLRTFVLPALAP